MNKQQLANRIWASANNMRNKIEANEYKDYILGLIFYKFLSDTEVKYFTEAQSQPASAKLQNVFKELALWSRKV